MKRQRRRDQGVFQYGESKEYKGSNKLREYNWRQLDAALLAQPASSILADEMGLGKDVQVVSSRAPVHDGETPRPPRGSAAFDHRPLQREFRLDGHDHLRVPRPGRRPAHHPGL